MQTTDKKNVKLLQERDARMRERQLNHLVKSRGVLGNNPNYNSSIGSVEPTNREKQMDSSGPNSLVIGLQESVTPNQQHDSYRVEEGTTENSQSKLKSVPEPSKTPNSQNSQKMTQKQLHLKSQISSQNLSPQDLTRNTLPDLIRNAVQDNKSQQKKVQAIQNQGLELQGVKIGSNESTQKDIQQRVFKRDKKYERSGQLKLIEIEPKQMPVVKHKDYRISVKRDSTMVGGESDQGETPMKVMGHRLQDEKTPVTAYRIQGSLKQQSNISNDYESQEHHKKLQSKQNSGLSANQSMDMTQLAASADVLKVNSQVGVSQDMQGNTKDAANQESITHSKNNSIDELRLSQDISKAIQLNQTILEDNPAGRNSSSVEATKNMADTQISQDAFNQPPKYSDKDNIQPKQQLAYDDIHKVKVGGISINQDPKGGSTISAQNSLEQKIIENELKTAISHQSGIKIRVQKPGNSGQTSLMTKPPSREPNSKQASSQHMSGENINQAGKISSKSRSQTPQQQEQDQWIPQRPGGILNTHGNINANESPNSHERRSQGYQFKQGYKQLQQFKIYGNGSVTNNNTNRQQIHLFNNDLKGYQLNGAKTAAKNSMVSLPSGHSQRQGILTAEGRKRQPANLRAVQQNSDIEGVISHKKLDVDSSNHDGQQKSVGQRDNEYSSLARAHPFARAMNRPDLMSFKRGSMLVGRQSVEITDIDSTFKASKYTRGNKTSMGNYINYNGHQSQLPGIKNLHHRNIAGGKNSYSLSSAARATQSSINFNIMGQTRNDLNGPLTHNKHESTFTNKRDMVKQLGQITRLNQNSQGGPRVKKPYAQEGHVTSLPTNLVTDGISIISSMPKGIISSFDNNISITKKSQKKNMDGRKLSVADNVTIMRSSKVDSQMMQEFKDNYLNERKDTAEILECTMSPSKSPRGQATGVFERLEHNTIYGADNPDSQMPKYLIQNTDDSRSNFQKSPNDNYHVGDLKHASFRAMDLNANNSPSTKRLQNQRDKFLDSSLGQEKRLNYSLGSQKIHKRELTRSVLDSTNFGPDFSIYKIQKDQCSSGRMGDFIDNKKVKDTSRFFQKNSRKLNDSILDRLIGPSPVDLQNNSIMDRDTVNSIKDSRNKVVIENQVLKGKMSDMASIMDKTTGENQKLRSHIKVLIEDRQSYSGVPQNFRKGNQNGGFRSKSIGVSLEATNIGALLKQNKDIEEHNNDTVNYEYNEGKMFSQPYNVGESIHQSQFSANQQSLMVAPIPVSSSYELKTDYASALKEDQREFDSSVVPSHEVKITNKRAQNFQQNEIDQNFTNEMELQEKLLQDSLIKDLMDDCSPTIIRQKETFRSGGISTSIPGVSAHQTPIKNINYGPNYFLPPKEEVFINTMVLHQKDAKFHIETDMALTNAFKVTEVIKDELTDANKDIQTLRQKLLMQSNQNKKLVDQNFNLKDKLNQYRRQIVQQGQDSSSDEETHSLMMQQSKATADISPRKELYKPMGKQSTKKIDLMINMKDLDGFQNPDKRSHSSLVDDEVLNDEDDEANDGVMSLEGTEELEQKRFSELLRMRRQTSLYSHKPRSSILKTSQQFTGASGLSGPAQDLVAECVSLMIEKSHNTKQLFKNLEVTLLKIMGKFCSGVHFMIADPEFAREIRAGDKGQNQFLFRQLIISSDVVDLVHIKRPPQNPFQEKGFKKSKEQLQRELDAHQKGFAAFLPDFSQVSKVESMSMVKSRSVIFPVHNLKRNSTTRAGPQRSDLKMLIQLDIPRDKIGLDRGSAPANLQLQSTNSRARRPTLGLNKQTTSLALQRQGTSVFSSNAADKAAIQAASEEYNLSVDCMKQVRLVTNCFMITLEQIKQEKRANYNESRVSQILAVMKIFMKAKQHQELYDDLQTHLPDLFGYTNAGVLFYDENGGNLFSIRCNDYKNTQITDEHLMQFPLGMGITGVAINSEKAIVSNEGEEDPRYSFEVDNHLQLLDFENLLVVPLVDSKGQLKGAIQMINKIGQEEIPETDIIEFNQIAQSIAEAINFCHLSKSVSDVSDGLTVTMTGIKNNIDGSYQHFRHPQMPEVMYHLDQISRAARELVKTKREGAFGHGTLVQKIFDDLQKKQQKNINEKKRNLEKQMSRLGELSGMGVATEKDFCGVHGQQSFQGKK